MKGDVVLIRCTTPGGADVETGIEVIVSGRRLRMTKDRDFLTVREETRTGRVTRSLQVRLSAISSYETIGEDVM